MKVGFTGSHGYLGRSTASNQRSAECSCVPFLDGLQSIEVLRPLKKPPPSLCAGGGLFLSFC